LSIAGSNNLVGVGAGNGNTIGNSSGNGVLIEGDSNVLEGNFIGTDAAGAERGNAGAGVLIPGDSGGGISPDGNTIGGDAATSENVISNNGGDAVEIRGPAEQNRVLRNTGSDNTGLFIDLRLLASGDGFGNPGGPNGGIEAPTIDSGATSESVSGSGAESGATVRVYRTETLDGSNPNDIVAFVGSDQANASGEWSLNCPGTGCAAEAPGPGQFTANQTDTDGNSSELAKAESYTAAAPNTNITSGPTGGSTISDPTPTFGFSSSEGGSSFQCRIDGGAFGPCSGPGNTHTPATPLSDGQHTFEVRAVDAATNADPSPASRTFTVDTTPPNTTIDSGPVEGSTINDPTPTFGFSSNEGGSSFQCRIDGGAFGPCSGPGSTHTPATPLSDGQHTFEVRATDPVGNVEASPASRTFTVDTTVPPPPVEGGAPPPPDGVVPLPSNEFGIGKLNGLKLTLTVPGPGTVEVRDAADQSSGEAMVAATKTRLKPSSATALAAGEVTVKLKLTKKAKQSLKQRGAVKVNAAITYTPSGGSANTKTAKLKVKKKK
jgi:hypothetical protein